LKEVQSVGEAVGAVAVGSNGSPSGRLHEVNGSRTTAVTSRIGSRVQRFIENAFFQIPWSTVFNGCIFRLLLSYSLCQGLVALYRYVFGATLKMEVRFMKALLIRTSAGDPEVLFMLCS
jgi:hypothetical protein